MSAERIPNIEQAEQWGGEEGQSWVAHHRAHDRMVAALTPRLLAAAQIRPRDHILDVGCGCGETAYLAALEAPHGHVVGLDISARMLDAARTRIAQGGIDNISFLEADAQTHHFNPETFDLVLSRFGVMFFDNPPAAFSNVATAMTHGARLAFLCWQEALENEWIVVAGAAIAAHVALPELDAGGPGPFSLGDPEHVRSLLAGAGLSDVTIEGLTEPVNLGSDVKEAVGYLRSLGVVRALLSGIDQDTVAKLESDLTDALQPYAGDDGVRLGSASWLVTARRV